MKRSSSTRPATPIIALGQLSAIRGGTLKPAPEAATKVTTLEAAEEVPQGTPGTPTYTPTSDRNWAPAGSIR